jgi:hypothetical protein
VLAGSSVIRLLKNPKRILIEVPKIIFFGLRYTRHPYFVFGRILKVTYLRHLWAFRHGRRSSSTNLKRGFKASFEDLNIFYINLDVRVDRKVHIEKELKKIGIQNHGRFSAIKRDNGALGCAASHHEILKHSTDKNKAVMIVEDDAEFLLPKAKYIQYLSEFLKNPAIDVLCLGNNVPDKRSIFKISESFSISNDIQTTSCYIVKPRAIRLLKRMAAKSINGLKMTKNPEVHAIDIVWKIIQSRIVFAIPNVQSVRQIDSYSDIEKKFVSYGV